MISYDYTLTGFNRVENYLNSISKNMPNELNNTFKATADLVFISGAFRTFEAEGARDGEPKWTPLSNYTLAQDLKKKTKLKSVTREQIEKHRGDRRILQDSGKLRNSILIQKIDNNGVVVGTNLMYAPQQQYGDTQKNIPPRPFLFITEKDITKIMNIVKSLIMRLFK